MRKTICLFLITSIFLSCNKLGDFFPNPTPSAPQFNKLYGGSEADGASSIAANSDGSYVVAGYTESNDGEVSGYHGNVDAWVFKLDKTGNITWQKALGGSNNDKAFSIISTRDKNYVMVGRTESNDGDVAGYHGGIDAWVVKLDGNGHILWQKVFGGSGYDNANSVAATLDGGYVLAGYTESNDGNVSGNHGMGDMWVVKLDKDGNIIWQKTLGGSNTEVGYSVTATSDGGYVMAASTQSNDGDVSGYHGNIDAWIVKLDKDGNKLWQKTLGGSGTDLISSVTQNTNGDYIMAGVTGSTDGDVSGYHGGSGDAWVVKLGKNGNIIWQKLFGGSDYDASASIITSLDGGYVLAGETTDNNGNIDTWVMKIDRNGSIVWQKDLGSSGSGTISSIIGTTNGYITAGSAGNNGVEVSHGRSDVWVMTLKDN